MPQRHDHVYRSLARVVRQVTKPLVLPLRRVLRPYGKLDTSAIVLMLVSQFANVWLVLFVSSSPYAYAWGSIVFWTVFKLVFILVNLYFFSILLEAVISWLGQGRSPLDGLLRPLNAPLLNPVRRVLPPTSGLDFSPLVVMLVLQVINLLLPLAWPIV